MENIFSNTNTKQNKKVQTDTNSTRESIIKVFNFTKISTTIEKADAIHYILSIRGSYCDNNIDNDISMRNVVKNVKHSGNVPPDSNYRDMDNKTLGSSEI